MYVKLCLNGEKASAIPKYSVTENQSVLNIEYPAKQSQRIYPHIGLSMSDI